MEPCQSFRLISYFTLVIPTWNLKESSLARAKGTFVAGAMCYLLQLSCRSLWCCQKCPWELSSLHGGHCTPKQGHSWPNRSTEGSIPVWKAGVLGKRPSQIVVGRWQEVKSWLSSFSSCWGNDRLFSCWIRKSVWLFALCTCNTICIP